VPSTTPVDSKWPAFEAPTSQFIECWVIESLKQLVDERPEACPVGSWDAGEQETSEPLLLFGERLGGSSTRSREPDQKGTPVGRMWCALEEPVGLERVEQVGDVPRTYPQVVGQDALRHGTGQVKPSDEGGTRSGEAALREVLGHRVGHDDGQAEDPL
jgi:hypothetical protein